MSLSGTEPKAMKTQFTSLTIIDKTKKMSSVSKCGQRMVQRRKHIMSTLTALVRSRRGIGENIQLQQEGELKPKKGGT